MTQMAYTIDEFCEAHKISRSLFYKLPECDRPKVVRLGRRRIITMEAAADWRERLERQGGTAMGATPKLPE